MLAALRRILAWSGIVALLALSPGVALRAHADGEPVKFTIKTTDAGFEPNEIEVEQGSLVEITFVWDHVAYPNEEHIMVFKDYKVESGQIDAEHRETTVSFIASESGTFTFKCDLECDLHDYLQGGQLIVVPGGGGGSSATLTPTELRIPPAAVSIRGDTVSVIASLVDEQGNPVPKAEVQFLVEETFAGTTSLAEVAIGHTDDSGMARITYKPTREGAENLVVRFAGAGIYASAETALEVPNRSAFGPVQLNETEHLGTLRASAPGAFLAVMIGIWAVFAFALYKVWSVSRSGEGGET